MSSEIKVGNLYKEKDPGVKFPKIVKIRKIQDMGGITHVQFMADNAAAQSAHRASAAVLQNQSVVYYYF